MTVSSLTLMGTWERLTPQQSEHPRMTVDQVKETVEAGVDHMASMPLSEFIGKVIVPVAPEAQAGLSTTFQNFVSGYLKLLQDSDLVKNISRGAALSIRHVSELYEQAGNTKDKARELAESFVGEIIKKVVRFVFKRALMTTVRFIAWIFREIIYRGMMLMVEFLIRPVITAVVGFIFSNPITASIAVALGGAVWLGYKIWNHYFSDEAKLAESAGEKRGWEGLKHDVKSFFSTSPGQTKDQRTQHEAAQRALTSAPLRRTGVAAEAPSARGSSAAPVQPIAVPVQQGQWYLGQTSKRYESGSGGPGTISSGVGDLGGVSYGTYQLSSKTGTLQEFLKQSGYASAFAGLTPATPEFNKKWKELAEDPKFGEAQHEFIKASHFDIQMKKLVAAGYDFSGRGPAVLDAIWSMSVQFRNGTLRIVNGALDGKKWQEMKDSELVTAFQDYKIANNDTLFKSSSAAVRAGTLLRATREKNSLVALAKSYEDKPTPSTEARGDSVPVKPGVQTPGLTQSQAAAQTTALTNSTSVTAPQENLTVVKTSNGQLTSVNIH